MVKADEITKCYGKHRVKDGKDQCTRRKECPWGEACLSRSGEEAANAHYHLANVSIGMMLYDPNREDDDPEDGMSGFSEEEQIAAEAEREVFSIADENVSEEEDPDVELDGVKIPGSEYEIVLQAVERISEMYFNTPTSFEMLMKSIFQKKNQSDVAKERGITRQGLNKRLLYELGIAQKRNDIQQRRDRELAEAKKEYADKLEELRKKDEFFRNLSARDWKIYKLVLVEGKSYSYAAETLNCSEKTVYRVSKFLRSKIAENVHIPQGRKPKTKIYFKERDEDRH